MSTPHVQFETDGSRAVVTFNRPGARNAMTWPMYEALVEHCATVDGDDAIRVLILRGAGGRAFVAGTDIAQFRDFTTAADGLAYEQRLDAVVDRLEAVSKPTIAQIDGVATGGGCALAAACDLRVCTPQSRFGIPIARTLGNCLSAANHARLLDLIGPARLKELLFTGRLLDAEEAAAAGLVNRIAADRLARRGRARIRGDDGRERAADHSRDQGDGAPDSGPPTHRPRRRPRSHRALLHERRFPRGRRRVPGQACPAVDRRVNQWTVTVGDSLRRFYK